MGRRLMVLTGKNADTFVSRDPDCVMAFRVEPSGALFVFEEPLLDEMPGEIPVAAYAPGEWLEAAWDAGAPDEAAKVGDGNG